MEFSTSTYVFFFIILIIIIILVFIFIYLSINPKKPINLGLINLQPPSNVTSTLGSSINGVVNLNNGDNFRDVTTCNNQLNSVWLNVCTCTVPYYSNSCDIQSYDTNYTAIGQINDNQVITTEYNIQNNNFLSFNNNGDSCTEICDNDNDCIGVKWQNNVCTLLKDEFIVKPNQIINYDLYQQANYYLKNSLDVQLKDRVIVYTGVRPLRYWIPTTFTNSSVNFMSALFENIQYPLNYRPLWLINNTDGWVGLVSNSLIIGDYQDLYNNPPDNIKPIPFVAGTTNLMEIIPPEWNMVHIVFFQLV